MYTTIRHELSHAGKAWLGTLLDPRLLSGHDRRCTHCTVYTVYISYTLPLFDKFPPFLQTFPPGTILIISWSWVEVGGVEVKSWAHSLFLTFFIVAISSGGVIIYVVDISYHWPVFTV
jgi:hypothetical protein